MSSVKPVTEPMLRELRSIAWDGNPSDPYEWTHAPEGLWFSARDKVLGALLRRGLIDDSESSYKITEAGRIVLKSAQTAESMEK